MCKGLCECGCLLVDINHGSIEEVYCPSCDVGEKVEPDGMGDFGMCGCGCLLSTWFLFSQCPECLNGKPIPKPVRPDDMSPPIERRIMVETSSDILFAAIMSKQ